MYNRYIPGTNGVYERQVVPEPKCPPVSIPTPLPLETNGQQSPQTCQKRFLGFDLGDLLLICILILLLIEGEDDDPGPAILFAAAFLMQQ